ncbi:MAG: sigma-54 dependent transcriptional regulator [Bacteroidetes bacterium]|nr:sigma-54 dependent transcriptional regulator [Bacteroidota bacterium]
MNNISGDIPNKKKVLIIDNECIIGISCKRILEQENYEATYHSEPLRGLAEALTGNYEIILLDLIMPDLDGLEILSEVKSRGITSDVIIFTGYATVKTAVEAIRLGASDYVSKPFSPEELKIIIDKVVKHSDLLKENYSLKKELDIHQGFKGIICDSPQMKEIVTIVKRIAPTDGTVCITGDSGTGKEVIANAIHRLSRRNDKPFIACDCSSLASTLLESELFGHVKGSFSGAISTKQGLFEAANKGTLFLDEISNISLETQSKLLRVLETRQVRKVGDTKLNNIDIRLITATNKDLSKMVLEGTFREDLYYRLQGLPIFLPPLRERTEDIIKLAMFFLNDFLKNNSLSPKHFSNESVEILEKYTWPGNIRELKNIVERIAIFCDADVILPEFLPKEVLASTKEFKDFRLPDTWDEFKKFKHQIQNEASMKYEKRFLNEALQKADGNISKAAKNVGIQRTQFHLLLQKYNMNARTES